MDKINYRDNIDIQLRDLKYSTSTGVESLSKEIFVTTMDTSTGLAGGVITGWDLRPDISDNTKLEIYHNNVFGIGVAYDKHGNLIKTSTGYTGIVIPASINYVTLLYITTTGTYSDEPLGRLKADSGIYYQPLKIDTFQLEIFSSTQWALKSTAQKSEYVLLGVVNTGAPITITSTGRYYISSLIQPKKIDASKFQDALNLIQTQISKSVIYSDTFSGSKSNLQDDLNEIRTLLKLIIGKSSYLSSPDLNLKIFDNETNFLHNEGTIEDFENEFSTTSSTGLTIRVKSGKAIAGKRLSYNPADRILSIPSPSVTSTGLDYLIYVASDDQGQTKSLAHGDILPGTLTALSLARGRTYIENVDYVINYANGTFYNIIGGDIAGNETVVISYEFFQYRYDLLQIDNQSVLSIKQGTPNDITNVKPPFPDANNIGLQHIRIVPGDTQLQPDDVIDARHYIERISKHIKIDETSTGHTAYAINKITFHTSSGIIESPLSVGTTWIKSADSQYDGGYAIVTTTGGAFATVGFHCQKDDGLYLITRRTSTSGFVEAIVDGISVGIISLQNTELTLGETSTIYKDLIVLKRNLTQGYHRLCLTNLSEELIEIDYLLIGDPATAEIRDWQIEGRHIAPLSITHAEIGSNEIEFPNQELNIQLMEQVAIADPAAFNDSSIITKEINYLPEMAGANIWTSKSTLSEEKYDLTGFSLNGFGYVSGGNNHSYSAYSTGYLSTVERYNDDLNQWESKSPLSTSKSKTAGFTLDNHGYLVGGSDGSYISVVEQYDDILDSRTTKSSINTARSSLAGIKLGIFGYIFGGELSSSTYTDKTDRYDSILDLWSSMTTLITARRGLMGFEAQNFGFSVSGYTSSFGISSLKFEIYNDSLNTWLSLINLSILSSARNNCAAFNLKNCGYWAGGWLSGSPGTGTFEYNPTTRNVIREVGFSTPRGSETGFALNSVGFSIGGKSSQSSSSTIMYNLVDRYSNFTFYYAGALKSSSKDPLKILIGTAAQDNITTVPVQVCTDGVTWYNTESNKDSFLKTGQDILTKLQKNSHGYYNYEIKVGLPMINQSTGEGFWSIMTSLITARSQLAGFSLNGKGFVAGGYSGTYVSSTEQYDDSLNTWSDVGNLTLGVYGPASCTLHGYAFLFGGVDSTAAFSARTERYNDILELWTLMSATLTTARLSLGGFSLNGFGYSCLGISGAGYSNLTQRYNFSTDVWGNDDTSNAQARRNLSCMTLDGYGYAVGGSTGSPVTTVDRYADTYGTSGWDASAGGDLTIATNTHACFSLEQFGYIVGGSQSTGRVAATSQYNSSNKIWNLKNSLSAVKNDLTSFSLNGAGLAAGGSNGSDLATVEKYNTTLNPVILGITLQVIEKHI